MGELALFYLSSKNDFVVTGLATDVNHIEKTLKILRIDHIIIAGANARFIESTHKTICKISSGQDIIILNLHNRKLNLTCRNNNSLPQIISFDQKPESLFYVLESHNSGKKGKNTLSTHTQEAYLSKREKQILLLISKGKNSKEIADELFISSNTVDNHRNNILKKTRSKNMLSLINHLFRTGFFASMQPNLEE